MPGRTDNEKSKANLKDLLKEVGINRHEVIHRIWKQYRAGALDCGSHPPSESHLHLVPSETLKVRFNRDEYKNTITSMQVRNLFESRDTNFMGYDQEARCLAFRGETRHLDAFLNFAYGMVNSEQVEHVFKVASEVRVPEGGLEPDLEYDEFASQVEIVEYGMWLKNVPVEQGEIEDRREPYTIISVLKDGTHMVLPVEGGLPADENNEDLQPETPQGTDESGMEEDPAEHATFEEGDPPGLTRCETPENELSLVPSPLDPEPLEDYNMQQQMEADAAIEAAMETEIPTRYSLRARTRTGEDATPSPKKKQPPRAVTENTTPKKALPRKKGIAQRKKPKRR